MRSTSFVYVLSCLVGIPDIVDTTFFSVRYLVSHMFDMCEGWELILSRSFCVDSANSATRTCSTKGECQLSVMFSLPSLICHRASIVHATPNADNITTAIPYPHKSIQSSSLDALI